MVWVIQGARGSAFLKSDEASAKQPSDGSMDFESDGSPCVTPARGDEAGSRVAATDLKKPHRAFDPGRER